MTTQYKSKWFSISTRQGEREDGEKTERN